MTTLRLEVGSFELELRQVDVAGDAPGLEGELLTAVNELGTGAGGFHLVVVDMVHRVIVDMIIVNIATRLNFEDHMQGAQHQHHQLAYHHYHHHDQGAPELEDH